MTAELGPERQAGPFLHNRKTVGTTVILGVIRRSMWGKREES